MKEWLQREHEKVLRHGYISDIGNIQPLDLQESEDITTTLEWLRTAQFIHKPENMNCHLGVLFMLLSRDRKQTFLVNHKKAQLWIPPGGHVDVGLTLKQAVELEMLEELNKKPKFINTKPFFLTRTLTTGLNSGHIDVTSWFLLEGSQHSIYKLQSKEADEGRWFELNNIDHEPSNAYLARAIRKIQTIY